MRQCYNIIMCSMNKVAESLNEPTRINIIQKAYNILKAYVVLLLNDAETFQREAEYVLTFYFRDEFKYSTQKLK